MLFTIILVLTKARHLVPVVLSGYILVWPRYLSKLFYTRQNYQITFAEEIDH